MRIDAYLEGLELDVDAITDGEDVLIPGLIEHVERAGVHSGDSIGVYPPQRISAADQELVVDAITRIARAIGVRGLINGQFIVRDDGVYLLEVNPRASRTVPFLSKVTGVPMIELATRIALGATLRELGWASGLLAPRPFVAVKAPVFSTAKLRGVDPMLGPGDAVDRRGHRPARRPARRAWPRPCSRPRCGRPWPGRPAALALLSIADRDKDLLAPLAAAPGRWPAIASARRAARPSRCACLGHDVEELARVGDGRRRPTLRASMRSASGDVALVVNTPSPESRPDAGRGRASAAPRWPRESCASPRSTPRSPPRRRLIRPSQSVSRTCVPSTRGWPFPRASRTSSRDYSSPIRGIARAEAGLDIQAGVQSSSATSEL